jgi:hypothetical protein
MDVQGYLDEALPAPETGRLLGLVAPHAGYLFSGHVAGAAFAGLKEGDFETVVLLGPDHRGATGGRAATLNVEAWRTPLGDVPVAWEVLDALRPQFPFTLLPSDEEHALEIELPFLQMTLKQFKLAPLIMGDQSPETCRRLGTALAQVISGSTLLVASSDLSHYFDDETARRLDQATLAYILNLDGEGLATRVEESRQPLACGAGPVAVLLHAAGALGASQATLRKYATSADVHPLRKDRVVGYAAVAISKN